jgi:GTP-binding protein EngB required for normal cell division
VIGRRRRAPDLAGRVTMLETALTAGDDRLDPREVARARAVLDRTSQRMRLGADTTIVALAGSTGSGKSSLFNALAGMEISEVGPRRPTTGKPMACAWGGNEIDPMLDWLEVPRRHRLSRESVLDADREAGLHGLLLLDLPDHDSTLVAHRLEVDRLVDLVDLLVWVVDPQKYADELLHSGYLRPLAGHDSVMLVVLNQIDRLARDEVETCRRDLRRLLDADGLESVRLLTASARTGEGTRKLRSVLVEVVQEHGVVVERAAADLDAAARDLGSGVAGREASPESLPGADVLVDALSAAAGVPVVLDAVVADYRMRSGSAVGWPFLRWVRRLRPDPLRRLHLGEAEADVRRLTRSSLPNATSAQAARVELAVHAVTAAAAEGLPERWTEAVRGAVTLPGDDLTDALDQAVVGVELDLRTPVWWKVTGGLQIVLALTALAGLGWLTVLGVLGWLRLPVSDPPRLGPLPLPTVLLLGGLSIGLVLAWLLRGVVRIGAARRRERARAQLRGAVRAVVDERILAPVVKVLVDHRLVREALAGFR